MDVVVGACWKAQKCDLANGGHEESDDYYVPWESWIRKELANGEEVDDGREDEGCHEGGTAAVVEVAGADNQGDSQTGAECVDCLRGGKLHLDSVPVRDRAAASSHSRSHSAVRGALSGAWRNSAARRAKSAATSMS